MKNLISVKTAEILTDSVMDLIRIFTNLLTWFAIPCGIYIIAVAIMGWK